ncbi:MAG: hypothetical protein KGZ59_12030 [Chitinophagaceae bacterium]|nr:hypothetical protein [Chitinophagaceae bacterium]
MNRQIKKLVVMVMLILPLSLLAQQNKDEFSATLAYQSLAHFMGRTDSLNSTATVPIIAYRFKSGFYSQIAGVLVQNSATPLQYTGTTFELGFHFLQNDSTFSGNVFGTYFDYKDKSVLVRSALKYQLGVNTSFKNNIVNINPSINLLFSDKTDLNLSVGFDHLFVQKLKEGLPRALAFNPTITLYAGTQNFTDTYKRNIGSPFVPIYQTETKSVTTLSFLAMDFTLPIVYVAGKFNAFITPSYVMPYNLIKDAGERGENRFYFTAGIGIRL